MRSTKEQEHTLVRQAGARRWVGNWGLARWKEVYAETGKSISLKQLSAELTTLKSKPGTAWLKEADAQLLQQALKDLHHAFVNFFARRAHYPRFKSRKRDSLRFRIPQRVKVADGKVYVPKVGLVRMRQSQAVGRRTKSATFRRDLCGQWYASLTVEFDLPDVAPSMPHPTKVVGVDLGLIDFATLSDGSRSYPSTKVLPRGPAKAAEGSENRFQTSERVQEKDQSTDQARPRPPQNCQPEGGFSS
ncbi:MAG: transposase [Acetobacteraceae bacterium]|nr:transposase [Acetobacteraceae bacterium]